MIYNVVFNVDEEELLDLATDQGKTDLTPLELFTEALNSLEESGITFTEITEVK